MKITLLGTAYPYRGGIAAFTERLARAFQNSGDDVNISIDDEYIIFDYEYPTKHNSLNKINFEFK